MDTAQQSSRREPVLNPGSIFTNVRGGSVLCVIEVHSCNGESQDGTRVRATETYVAYDVGAAFVLEPWVEWLLRT